MVNPEETGEPPMEIPNNKVEKEEMVGFLSSAGKMRTSLAEAMYNGGLDNWAALVNGDEPYFRSFKGVGVKTAGTLLEAAKQKKEDLRETLNVPTLKEILSSIPRVSDGVIDTLMENGYNTFEKFKDLEAETLQELKGIGPKLSIAIIEKVNEAREKYGIREQDIEEATGLPVEEDKDSGEGTAPGDKEKGFFEKLIEGIKALFVGKKNENLAEDGSEETKIPPPTEPKTDEKMVTPEDLAVAPAEIGIVETPVEEVSTDKETITEEPVDGSEEPAPAPEDEINASETEEVAQDTTPPQEKKGFFQTWKEKIFGTKKEEEPSPDEPKVIEEGVKEDLEATPEPSPGVPVQEEPLKEDDAGMDGPFKLRNISLEIQEKLSSSGYLTIEELREAVIDDLTMIDGIDMETAERICNAVKK